MRIGLFRTVLTCLACLLFAGTLPAEVIPGTEFQVNNYSVNAQRYPAVALDADFDFVVVWQSFDQDGNGEGVFARRYDSAGVALGAPFQVNSHFTFQQAYPAVALAANGDFVVVWSSNAQDGSNTGVFAQRFSFTGAHLGSEFQVNTYTLGSQAGAVNPPNNAGPAIAAQPNGDFVIVWHDLSQEGIGAGGGIFGRRFDAAGMAIGGEFHVNTYTTGGQRYPSVGVDADGDFVVAWQSFGLDGDNEGVIARRFDATGTAVTGEFVVNDLTALNQQYAAIGINPVGDFVVAWQSSKYGTLQEIAAKRFDNVAVLDIDANGAVTALGDGIMVLRFLFEFTGTALVEDAVDEELCQRCEAAEIEAYLGTLI